MSEGAGLSFTEALTIAGALVEDLAPAVRRVKVAGSLRRKRPRVNDIELVAEPEMHGDLFGGQTPVLPPVHMTCRRWGDVVKGGDRYVQIVRSDGLKIDLFLVHPPAQWGPILAIRTGPAWLGQLAGTRMRERGFRCHGGHIERLDTGEIMPCESEEQFFDYAAIPFQPPAKRDAIVASRLGAPT